MKKTMLTIAILIFTFIFSSTNNIGLVKEVYAWDDCPKGLVNDEYPGSCPRYVDTDENGICDHSEPAPEDRVENQNPVKVTGPEQHDNLATPTDNAKFETNSSYLVVLSIFIPLITILAYAGINKIKQENKS